MSDYNQQFKSSSAAGLLAAPTTTSTTGGGGGGWAPQPTTNPDDGGYQQPQQMPESLLPPPAPHPGPEVVQHQPNPSLLPPPQQQQQHLEQPQPTLQTQQAPQQSSAPQALPQPVAIVESQQQQLLQVVQAQLPQQPPTAVNVVQLPQQPQAIKITAEQVAQHVSTLSSRLAWVSPTGTYQSTGSPNIPRLRDMYHKAAVARMNLLGELSSMLPVNHNISSAPGLITQVQVPVSVPAVEERRRSRSRSASKDRKRRHDSRERSRDRRERSRRRSPSRDTRRLRDNNDNDRDGDDVIPMMKKVFFEGTKSMPAPRYLKKARFCQLLRRTLGRNNPLFQGDKTFEMCMNGPRSFLADGDKFDGDSCFVLQSDLHAWPPSTAPSTVKQDNEMEEERQRWEKIVPNPHFNATKASMDHLVKAFFANAGDDDADYRTEIDFVTLMNDEELQRSFKGPNRAKLIEDGCSGPYGFMTKHKDGNGTFYKLKSNWSILEDHIMEPQANSLVKIHRLPREVANLPACHGETEGFHKADLGNSMASEYFVQSADKRNFYMRRLEGSYNWRSIVNPSNHVQKYFVRKY